MKRKIKVVDSIMGSGKTNASINYINRLDEDSHVLFVTPFLKECERVIDGCPFHNFIQPSNSEFGTKGRHFKHLLKKERNIVCTHALFSYIDDEIIEILHNSSYILILDEVLDVVSTYDIFKYFGNEMTEDEKTRCTIQDVDSLIFKGYINIRDDYSVEWSNDERANLKYYENMKNLANRGLLYYVNDTVLFWTFPIEVFEEGIFKDIYVLTYLFEYQIQAYYYRFHNIEWKYYHVETLNGVEKFVPTTNHNYEREWKNKVRSLIHIHDGDTMNKLGQPYISKRQIEQYSTLSLGWYQNHPEEYEEVERCIYNWLRKAPADKRMYTTFKQFNQCVKPRRVGATSFVPLNSKATNEYGDRTQCAYMVNRYVSPYMKQLFLAKGIEINEDLFALSEMIQWVWRSAIRNGEEIELYIPSLRMRTLFKQWLNDEEVGFSPFKQSEYFARDKKRG